MYTYGIRVNKLVQFSLVNLFYDRSQLRTQKGREKIIFPPVPLQPLTLQLARPEALVLY